MPRLEHARRQRLATRVTALLTGLAATVVVAAGTASCGLGQDEDLPEATELLNQSATAMRDVSSARFDLQVDGELLGLPLTSAEGQLTSEGSAQGTFMLDMGAQPFEMAFVVLADEVYLRGPTGGFQQLSDPPDLLPTGILSPNQGVSDVLASGTEAETEARENVSGVDSYRIQVIFPEEFLGQFIPGYPADEPSRVWVSVDDSRLVQGEFPTAEGTISFRFFDYDAPADISAPI